jgi:3-hydroxy-9,10-secoandrosta-1,3,5(10)-triene-9,17-dione monooxygenase reductase component
MRPASRVSSASKQDLRRIMGHYVTGATVVTATLEGQPYGMAVNSFTSVSLDPPLILFCPSKTSETWPLIERAGHFIVNILGQNQDELCRQFAAKRGDRFAATELLYTLQGNPVLAEAVAFLDCRVQAVHEAGDHFVTIGHVLDMGLQQSGPPLVFYQGNFHQLVGAESAGGEE